MASIQLKNSFYKFRNFIGKTKRSMFCALGGHVISMSYAGDSEYLRCSGLWRGNKDAKYHRAATCIYCGRRIYISDEEVGKDETQVL